MRSLLLIIGLLAGCATHQPAAPRADAARGRIFVERACAGCHAVGRADESLNAHAPPFRDLAGRRTDAELAQALGDISKNGHVEMPPIYVTPDEMRDVVAYMRSLTGRAA